jgi:hypothetical protein
VLVHPDLSGASLVSPGSQTDPEDLSDRRRRARLATGNTGRTAARDLACADSDHAGRTAEAWLSGAEAGIIRTRSGDPYKPSALRSYRHALQSKLLPELGRLRLSAIRRNDLQDLVDRMVAAGRSPSTVRNTILPLRAIYRRAIDRDQLAVNPT